LMALASADIEAYLAQGTSVEAVRGICSRITGIHSLQVQPAAQASTDSGDNPDNSAYEAAADFVKAVLDFSSGAFFPPNKTAVIVNIAAQVLLASKELPKVEECWGVYKMQMLASELLTVEEARVVTEFMSRTFFSHHHLYQLVLQGVREPDVRRCVVQIESPLAAMPLSLGSAHSAPDMDWVQDGSVWRGLRNALWQVDGCKGNYRTKGVELKLGLRWLSQLHKLLAEPTGPYRALPRSSVVEALTQLESLRCWLLEGAIEPSGYEEAAAPEEEEEAAAVEEGEEPAAAPPQMAGAAMKLWHAQLLKLEGWIAIELALSVLGTLSYSTEDYPQLRCVLRMLRHAVQMLEGSDPGCTENSTSWAFSVHSVADGQGLGNGQQGVSLVLEKGKIGSEAIVLDWIKRLNKPTAEEVEEPAAAEEEEEPAAEEEQPAAAEESEEDLAQREALRKQAEAEAALAAARELVLSMRGKIAELKGYSVEPSNAVVVRMVFQLLGAKAKQVDSWVDCRKKLGNELFTQISEFDAKSKPSKRMGTVARLRMSLEGVDQEAVNSSSEAVGGMFTWLTAALDAVEASVAATVAVDSTAQEEEEDSDGEKEDGAPEQEPPLELDDTRQQLLDSILAAEGQKLNDYFDPKLTQMKDNFIPVEE